MSISTDPLAGSELARVPLPDDVYGFGWAEIRYLLGRHATASSRMSVTSLGFDTPRPPTRSSVPRPWPPCSRGGWPSRGATGP